MNDPHSKFIIHQPFTQGQDRPTATGFISIQLKDLQGNQLSKPIGFALTRLIGNYFQTIEVVEMIDLPLERERIINFILSWSERVSFQSCYIDKNNYLQFNLDSRWSQLIRTRKLLIKYPFLRPCVRPEDPVFRQTEVLSEPLSDGRIKFAKSLNVPNNFSAVYQPGNSPSIDALAGSVEQTIRLQRGLLASISREQSKIVAANGRSDW